MNINDCFKYLNAGLPADIRRLKSYGDFEGAIKLIDRRLERDDQPEALRASMIAQREMMLRTPEHYPYTREEALALVRQYIADFTEEEFDERVNNGSIAWIYIKGQPRYFDRFFESSCKADPMFAKRAGIGLQGNESAAKGSDALDTLDSCILEMKLFGKSARRLRVRASLKLKDEYFEKGMFLRVHLPIAAACRQQSDIVIEKLWPENAFISPEDAAQRTVCWEGYMEENHEFSVVYSYTQTALYHDLEKPCDCSEVPDGYTCEQLPHIVFSPYIKELAACLTEGVDEPLEKARRIYDFITLKMKYSFMPDYICMEDIAENCARNYTGDCGVLALLFITLCRAAGIAARWQSGLAVEPDFCGAHDWAEFYIPGHGWLFADCSYGTAAVRAGSEERRRHYFGNLDPFRMVANSAFQADLIPNKLHWRADPYDNQLGEIESDKRGFRYCEFDISKETLLCEALPFEAVC